MNNLRRSRWTREIARGLTLLFFVPLLLSLPDRPAQGQSRVKTIAVMDFENPTGKQGLALGRKAADSVYLALPTDHFEVIDRDQIHKQIQSLGLVAPLDRESLIRLGKASGEGLGLEQIWTGRVLSAEVKKGSPRQAHVRLEIKVLDIAAGEFINGAVGEASSTPRYDDVNTDVLIDDAVSRAADVAVRNLMSRIIPVGTVLLNKEGEVYINIGEEAGVRPGMEMIVLRQGEKVGRLEVMSVTNRDATARIKEQTRGVMPEDRVQAVYTSAPSSGIMSTVTNMGNGRTNKGTSFGKIASIIGGVGLLVLAIKMFGTKNHVNVGATNVRAQASLTGNNQPAIHIAWQKPSTPAAPDLLGFKIYRSTTRYGNYSIVAEVAGPYETQFFDTTDDRSITVSQVGDASSGGSVSTSTQQVTGIIPGVTYYYRVSRVFLQADTSGSTNGGGNTTFVVVESDLSEPTGSATPVAKPQLQSPSQDETIDPTNVNFRWSSVSGGDQYRIQVSDTPSFDASRTYNSPDGDTRLTLPGGIDNQLMSASLNISTMFPATNPTTGQSTVRDLFWRVGTRHTADTLGPDSGFVFSDARRMKTQELPPPPVQ